MDRRPPRIEQPHQNLPPDPTGRECSTRWATSRAACASSIRGTSGGGGFEPSSDETARDGYRACFPGALPRRSGSGVRARPRARPRASGVSPSAGRNSSGSRTTRPRRTKQRHREHAREEEADGDVEDQHQGERHPVHQKHAHQAKRTCRDSDEEQHEEHLRHRRDEDLVPGHRRLGEFAPRGGIPACPRSPFSPRSSHPKD
jgi:hypothetical protein